ncbi:MAG: response regulator [Desulfobacteraceae bacterium]|nr:response regulator [Desulfobacteraceae bacterium]
MAHVLIIDDEEKILKMLSLALEREGHKVTTASDGKVGIKLYRETLADVVITDIVMPEMEGLEVIRILRQEFKDIKIIALSGGGFVEPKEYLNLAKNFGAQYTFTKPAELTEIISAIETLTK